MAIKNHALDDRIVEAATSEFLEHGFQDASLRRIAQRANLSTGALYTRYENKDALFCSIIEDALSEISKEFEPMRQVYMEVQHSCNAEKILKVIQQEEKIYLNIIFKYYTQCVLLFCRSDGSSIQSKWNEFIEYKAKETVKYLNEIAKKEVDSEGIELLLSEQFHCYYWILQKGMSKEKTISCLKTAEAFHEAGWRDLFQRIL